MESISTELMRDLSEMPALKGRGSFTISSLSRL